MPLSAPERQTIRRIARRAVNEIQWIAGRVTRPELQALITECHEGACPLRLAAFLSADGMNFGCDILGIVRNFDRATARLGAGFVPHFARHVARSHAA